MVMVMDMESESCRAGLTVHSRAHASQASHMDIDMWPTRTHDTVATADSLDRRGAT